MLMLQALFPSVRVLPFVHFLQRPPDKIAPLQLRRTEPGISTTILPSTRIANLSHSVLAAPKGRIGTPRTPALTKAGKVPILHLFIDSDTDIVSIGYTYPDIETDWGNVSLQDKRPENPEQRGRLAAILLTHFHPTPSRPKIIRPALESPIGLPEGYEPVDRYRRFTVLVRAVGHAFDGSYSIQLSYKGSTIGIFTVLFRGKDSQCAACRVRSNTGRRVRGLIEIPDDVVLDIIEDAKLDVKHLTSDDLSDEILKCISADLVGPTGVVLAVLQLKTNGDSIQESGSTLDQSIIPHLQLLSARIATPVPALVSQLTANAPEPGPTPIQFCDWKEHVSFDDGWKRA